MAKGSLSACGGVATVALCILASAWTVPAAAQATFIPRSSPGDKGTYYLLEKKSVGAGVVRTLHKRVGVDSTGYTRSEINCNTMRIRDLGYTEGSPKDMQESLGNWYELVPGSSKSDLATFVCGRN